MSGSKQIASQLKIAILGTRGIPARYGGFETFADELSRRLVARGHEVLVYCRKPFTTPEDLYDPRIRRVILPTISNKYLDTLFHTFLSMWHVIFTKAQVVLICNVANSPLAWIPRMAGKPTALNVDGLDRTRRKWNLVGRWFLQICEYLSVVSPTRVVTDALEIQSYYRTRYHKASTMIGYGAEPRGHSRDLKEFNLTSRHYILYVARLEPENNPALVIEAYLRLNTDWPLVIVGDNNYRPGYVAHLKSLGRNRVIFTGAIYDERYWTLQRNAGAFVFAAEVGGIHPALIEAMAAGSAVLYLDTPANRETAGPCGVPFEHDARDLAKKVEQVLGNPQWAESLRRHAREFALTKYSWDSVVDQYEQLFEEMLAGTGGAMISPALPEERNSALTGVRENHACNSLSDTLR
jgi:glycosyltransferase involved in cell wall biosynthesis